MVPRIKKRVDFLKVSHQGVKSRMRHFTLLCTRQTEISALPKTRIGFTASKRVGNAVQRNRAKRRMRTLADYLLTPTHTKQNANNTSLDFVIIAHNSLIEADRAILEADFQKAITHCLNQLKASIIAGSL